MSLPRRAPPHTPDTTVLHDAVAARALEARCAGSAVPSLMRRAGLSVARLATALAPQARSIWVAAGPGNNGGDGLIAAAELHRTGRLVTVTWLADRARLPVDAADAWAYAQAAGVKLTDTPPADWDLGIDALLGLGVKRPPDGVLAAAIAALNSGPGRVLAVDLPSGLDADTGQPWGGAVRADDTLSLLTLKPGLYTGSGRVHSGDIWFDDLGVETTAAPALARLAGAADVHAALPLRTHAQHKGSFGDVVVIGGAAGMGGAVRLAAHAALIIGAGRVYAAPLVTESPVPADSAVPELMWRDMAWALQPETLRARTAVCGCGGGDAVRSALPAVLGHCPRVVLDADALNALAADTALHSLLTRRAGRGWATVLTPHPLEAARLLGSTVADVQADRLRAAHALAQRCQAVVVLKGGGTVITAPGALTVINPTGNARLASPGTGDVLAGMIGGLWARAATAPPTDPLDAALRAATAAVWLHGRAVESETDDVSGNAVLPCPASRLIDAVAGLSALRPARPAGLLRTAATAFV